MKQTVIAFVGISGVGKTTFLRKVMESVAFQHLTAGSLIAAARAAGNEDRDNLRHANLDENQNLLIRGFIQAKDPKATVIILDAHVIIDAGDQLTEIASEVFCDLNVDLMVHLEAEPSQILANRAGDETRGRPLLSADVLRAHQKNSRERARNVAKDLGIDCLTVGHADLNSFIDCVKRHTHESGSDRTAP